MKLVLRILSILPVALLWLGSNYVLAHPGHDHELTKEQATLRARAVVSSLVEKQKAITGELLDESWNQATNPTTCKETPEFYLISIDNRESGKTLYLLLTSAGKYLRANFDGHFADLMFSSYPVQSC